jgi:hypothetical protein
MGLIFAPDATSPPTLESKASYLHPTYWSHHLRTKGFIWKHCITWGDPYISFSDYLAWGTLALDRGCDVPNMRVVVI